MLKTAIISQCGLYRYELRRIWDESLPPYVSGMLNPSTADDQFDDATITRNVRRAQLTGCGSLIVWNLGAGRATEPTAWKAMRDPIGPDTDLYIERILIECRDRRGVAVVGWGNHGVFRGRDKIVLALARRLGVAFQCVAINASGQPKHPLYASYDAPLIPWHFPPQ